MSLDTKAFRERLAEGVYRERGTAEGAVRRSHMGAFAKKVCLGAVAEYFEDGDVPPIRAFPPGPSQPLLPPSSASRATAIQEARKAREAVEAKKAPPALSGLEKARAAEKKVEAAASRKRAREPIPSIFPMRPPRPGLVEDALRELGELPKESELDALTRAAAAVAQLLPVLAEAMGRDVAATAAWVEAVAAAGRLATRASMLAGCGPGYDEPRTNEKEVAP